MQTGGTLIHLIPQKHVGSVSIVMLASTAPATGSAQRTTATQLLQLGPTSTKYSEYSPITQSFFLVLQRKYSQYSYNSI